MVHSIRLRFVGWLESVCDQIAEKVVERLRRDGINDQARTHNNLACAALNTSAAQSQAYCAVANARIQHGIGVSQGYLDRLNNDPVYIAYAKRLAASNNDLINHQNASRLNMTAGEIMRAETAGVEP